MHLKKIDLAVILACVTALGAVALASRTLADPAAAMLWVTITGFGLLTALVIELYRRLAPLLDEQHESYRQLEALHSLHALLDLRAPLPPMRGWAASPDFLNTLVETLRSQRPSTVVELGSGVSTVVCGYVLESLGAGRVVTLDHEADYAQKTRDTLKVHGLEAVTEVIHAPLVDTALNGKRWQWYDLSRLEGVDRIDVLVVDGPPIPIQPLSRYPALPQLFERLSDDAVVLVDDGDRSPVTEMVDVWRRDYPGIDVTALGHEKGAYVVRLNGAARPAATT